MLNLGMMSSELCFRTTTLAALKGEGRQRDQEAHVEVQKWRPRQEKVWRWELVIGLGMCSGGRMARDYGYD